jgi:hypothetical protein
MKKTGSCMLLVFLLSCNTNEKKVEPLTNGKREPITDSVVVQKILPNYNPESNLYFWKSSPDYTKIKNPQLSPDILNADSLIKGLNELNENILLEKINISGDTIYTEIKDSKFLAEGMGSTGAEMYVADVVLNLTEVPGIKYVNISLQEGSHMQPGTWSRDNFKKYKTIQ